MINVGEGVAFILVLAKGCGVLYLADNLLPHVYTGHEFCVVSFAIEGIVVGDSVGGFLEGYAINDKEFGNSCRALVFGVLPNLAGTLILKTLTA